MRKPTREQLESELVNARKRARLAEMALADMGTEPDAEASVAEGEIKMGLRLYRSKAAHGGYIVQSKIVDGRPDHYLYFVDDITRSTLKLDRVWDCAILHLIDARDCLAQEEPLHA